MLNKSAEGRMITHAIDSTTKKRVGQIGAQGIHIGKDLPFPLPLFSVSGETTEDIALQVNLGFEVMAAVRNVPIESLYGVVDTHMTDSTQHNKGFNVLLQEMYNLDKAAGQLFCGTHTTLGFSSALNKVTRIIEHDMEVEKAVAGFMVDMEVDSKNSSVVGQSLDMCLKLVAPEYSHKMWNYSKLFKKYLIEHNIPMFLFAYKDQRFDCLSRAAAVLLFYSDNLTIFIVLNTQITNRLSCLVRELLGFSYLKPALAVFAAYGLHLIEPFYATTISTD